MAKNHRCSDVEDLCEDRPGERVQVVPAGVAVPRRTFLDLVELTHARALRALSVRAVLRVAVAPQPLKARGIVRELAHELHERVGGLRGVRSDWVVAVNGGHGPTPGCRRTGPETGQAGASHKTGTPARVGPPMRRETQQPAARLLLRPNISVHTSGTWFSPWAEVYDRIYPPSRDICEPCHTEEAGWRSSFLRDLVAASSLRSLLPRNGPLPRRAVSFNWVHGSTPAGELQFRSTVC